MKSSIVYNKSKEFSIRIVKLSRILRSQRDEYVLYKQILKSGTSIGANLAEAFYGISDKDFTAKIFISLKECAETKYWLEILHDSNYITDSEFKSLDDDCTALLKMLTSIGKTMNKKIKRFNN